MLCPDCGSKLNPQMDFCPECGKPIDWQQQTTKPGFSKNKISILSSKSPVLKFVILAAIVVVLAIVVYMIVRTVTLQNAASNAKNNQSTSISSYNTSGYNSRFGNYPGSISAKSNVVINQSLCCFAVDDGIYCTKLEDSSFSEIGKSSRICSGKFSCLNFYDGNLYFIDNNANSIQHCDDVSLTNDKSPKEFYKPKNGSKLDSFEVIDGNFYILLYQNGTYELVKLSQNNNTGNVEIMGSYQGEKAWLSSSETVIKLCIRNGSSWSSYESEIGSKSSSGCTQVNSGNNNVTDVVFLASGLALVESSNSGAKLFLLDANGGRQEASLDFVPNKIIGNNGNIFIYSKDNAVIFNVDSFLSVDVSSAVCDSENVGDSLFVDKGSFGVLYNYGKITRYETNSKDSNSVDLSFD